MALAGILQSAALVQQLATTGHVSNSDMHTAIHSLFEQNPNSIDDVYSMAKDLEIGLNYLHNIMCRQNMPHRNDIVRYVVGMMHLQKKLVKRSDMLSVISSRLQQPRQQTKHFDITHDNVIASLASIYTETISTFNFRIQVTGDYNYLQQQRIANQIRVLLFAGIRACVLWRQLGGNRFQMITQRKSIIQTTKTLLEQVKYQHLH
ncbi:lysogenization regulator HflD [Candidatus Endobugula sertula]|uniref:High frequency lysogenization protein HflD homolog n=1 Tax=Candidatus Endobugula sertula TaxID=62101 RepID=A0A1D2QPD8_9GAMM|nr:lysogenization regulator HflD [Candidatus Endobugula sertula]